MRKIIFFVPYPLNTAPSQRFRFEQFIPKMKNYKISFYSFWSHREYKRIHSKDIFFLIKIIFLIKNILKRFLLLMLSPLNDIIFIHLELFPIYIPLVESVFLQLFKNRIIYDIDDFIFLPHSKNEMNKVINLLRPFKKYINYFTYSRYIFAATKFFSNYIPDKDKKLVVIPSCINIDKYKPLKDKENDKIIIGWTGSRTTSEYLFIIEEVIEKILKRYDVKVLIIGNKNFQFSFSSDRIIAVDWEPDKEVELIQQIDIGIYPLPIDNEWILGKCGLKAFQYMALEIPVVASDTPVNREFIIDNENGFLAKTNEEWYNKLAMLIENKSLRRKIGEKGREFLIKNYSLDVVLKKFIQYIDKI